MIIFYGQPNSRSEFVVLKDEKGNILKDVNGQNSLKEIVFIPGNNTISKKDWNYLKNLEIIKAQLEEGDKWFKIISDDEDELKSLDGINMPDAIKIVVQTFNRNLLELWRKSETRKKVVEVIEKQLEDLKPQGNK